MPFRSREPASPPRLRRIEHRIASPSDGWLRHSQRMNAAHLATSRKEPIEFNRLIELRHIAPNAANRNDAGLLRQHDVRHSFEDLHLPRRRTSDVKPARRPGDSFPMVRWFMTHGVGSWGSIPTAAKSAPLCQTRRLRSMLRRLRIPARHDIRSSVRRRTAFPGRRRSSHENAVSRRPRKAVLLNSPRSNHLSVSHRAICRSAASLLLR